LPAFAFAYTPATSLWLPNVRTTLKNHSLSRLIGPPSAKLVSQFLMILGTSVMPKARRPSSRLSPCDHPPAVLPNTVPLNVLPPVFGTRLNCGPPRSVSPRPPATVIWTSCELAVS
jgi:hypothetical protein